MSNLFLNRWMEGVTVRDKYFALAFKNFIINSIQFGTLISQNIVAAFNICVASIFFDL